MAQIDSYIAAECSKAAAHFATISVEKVRDLRKIALIVSRQGRGEVEGQVARAIAKLAEKVIAARA